MPFHLNATKEYLRYLIIYKDYFEPGREIQITNFIYSFKKYGDVSLCWLRTAEGRKTMTFRSKKKKSGLFVEARQKAMRDVNSLSQIRENI